MQHQSTIPVVSGIYRITHTPTGNWYIGSSKNIRDRWRRHCGDLKARTHSNRHLQAAWDTGGPDSLVLTVLQEVETSLLYRVEQAYLDREHPPMNVSTSARGGPHIREHSAKTRALISAKVRAAGHTPEHTAKLVAHLKRVRRPGTPERCKAMAKANIGSKRTEDTRAKMSNANRGRPVSTETRKKIGAANKGRNPHEWTDEQKRRVADAKREWWRLHKLQKE